MSDTQILVDDVEVDEDRHRLRIHSWWVQDPRIAGNPLSVYLYYMAAAKEARYIRAAGKVPAPLTQQMVMTELDLGKTAFRAAKEKLRAAGFLVEIRDRHPDDARDFTGKPIGRQNRYRLILKSPTPGLVVPDSESLIESEQPFEYRQETPAQRWGMKSTPGYPQGVDFEPHPQKGQVRAGVQNGHPGKAGVQNGHPLEEDTGVGRLVGSISLENKRPTDQPNRVAGAPAREATPPPSEIDTAAIDAELEKLLPGVGLTFAAIAHEVDGRVDLSRVDVVRAVQETVMRSKDVVLRPAAMVGAVIVRKPTAWRIGAAPAPAAWDPDAPLPSAVSRCKAGVHNWGDPRLPELARSHCATCNLPRRSVDPVFAELEDEHDFGGGL